MPKSPDDLEGLKAERAAADHAYNEALTRLDAAIQRLPATFPHPPPGPDEHQITPLNTLWKIDVPPAPAGLKQKFVNAVRRAVAPLFEQQQAFNAAVVDHANRTLTVDRQTRDAIATTLEVLRTHIEELTRFQSLLIVYLQQITPYVDTRDRDVTGLLRGLSGAINGVADELMKRTDALLARERRHEMQVSGVEESVIEVRAQIATLAAEIHRTRESLDVNGRRPSV